VPRLTESCGGEEVEPFREKAFYLLVWRAFLAALITFVLIVTSRYRIAAAFVIAANAALIFSLGLIIWARHLNDERIVWTEAWRMLKPTQRPAGIGGRRWARLYLNDVASRFAKASSAVAAALSASALIFASE
jgi:hypothetical protein